MNLFATLKADFERAIGYFQTPAGVAIVTGVVAQAQVAMPDATGAEKHFHAADLLAPILGICKGVAHALIKYGIDAGIVAVPVLMPIGAQLEKVSDEAVDTALDAASAALVGRKLAPPPAPGLAPLPPYSSAPAGPQPLAPAGIGIYPKP